MKNPLLCFLILEILFFNSTSGQVTFQKTMGGNGMDEGYDVTQTTDGGYLITGAAYVNGSTSSDAYLLKLNANGDSVWSKTYGGYSFDAATLARQTFDGGYIIAGKTTLNSDIYISIYLLKLNANGDTIWTRFIRGGNDYVVYDLKETADSAFVLAGEALDDNGGSDLGLFKIGATGNLLWARKFIPDDVSFGGDFQQTLDDGFILAGGTNSFLGLNPTRMLLIKTNSVGDTIWTRQFGPENAPFGSSASAVCQISNGSYIITGGDYIVGADSTGDLVWQKEFLSSSGGTNLIAVQQINDGNLLIAGSLLNLSAATSFIHLIKTNINGDTLWTRCFGPAGYLTKARAFHQTNDGGFIIVGSTSEDGFSSTDLFVVKTDSLGHVACGESYQFIQIGEPAFIYFSTPTVVTEATPSQGTPVSISGNAGKITTLCTNVVIENPENAVQPEFYPNPVQNFLTIDLASQSADVTIGVYDVLGGKIILPIAITNLQAHINTSGLPDGIYFLQCINSKTGVNVLGKFVKGN